MADGVGVGDVVDDGVVEGDRDGLLGGLLEGLEEGELELDESSRLNGMPMARPEMSAGDRETMANR